MEVEQTALDGVLILTPKRFGDPRGFFSESWNAKRQSDVGIDIDFDSGGHHTWTAFPSTTSCAGQASALWPWLFVRRGCGYPARITDFWAMGRRRAKL